MGNSFIFPVPKCSYTSKTLCPFYIEIPMSQKPSESKANNRKQIINVPALYLKSNVKSKYLFIYAHGNSEDLGRLYYSLLDYYERFQIDIIAPEYPGYGLHKGKTTASNLVYTLEQMILYASSPKGLGYELQNIILIGRSIGTGIVVETATRFSGLKGIILISAFLSIRDVAQNVAGAISRIFVPDIFKSYAIIDKVESPVLFIHGKKDTLIPSYHSVCLYYKARCVKQLYLPEEMDHNRSKFQRDIYKPIEEFLMNELQIKDHKDFIMQESKSEEYPSKIPEFLGFKGKSERKKRIRRNKEINKSSRDADDNLKKVDDQSKECIPRLSNDDSFVSKTDTSISFDNNNIESFIEDKNGFIEYAYDEESRPENRLMISKCLFKQNGFNSNCI